MTNAIAAAEPVLCLGGAAFLIYAAIFAVRTRIKPGGTK